MVPGWTPSGQQPVYVTRKSRFPGNNRWAEDITRADRLPMPIMGKELPKQIHISYATGHKEGGLMDVRPIGAER